MNPEELLTKTKEELVQELSDRNIENEQRMAEMVMIREELLNRLEEEKIDGEIIGEYQIRKSKRVTFKTTVEQAKEFGAIKPAVDSSILRKIHNNGIEVPGYTETVYLSVRRLEQKTS